MKIGGMIFWDEMAGRRKAEGGRMKDESRRMKSKSGRMRGEE
jgi:hypothetical protein